MTALERAIDSQALTYIRTTIVVCERVAEPEYSTVAEVLDAAEREPEVREVRRYLDLELLIDPIAQTRKLRHKLAPAGQQRFDQVKSGPGVRLVDVEIRCHEHQIKAITSRAPTVAAFGGNRAGKSMILVWRLFRRWMLRGGPRRRFWWVAPNTKKLIVQGVWVIAGELGLGGGVWPDEVFADLRACTQSQKSPSLRMIDGSTILFEHANHSGPSAGKNLKSENITDAVVDEVGAIKSEANWHQVQIRVSQTGGTVGASTTRVRDHWSHQAITVRAKEAGEDVVDCSHFDLFANPWMTYARIWQLFLADNTLSRRQLEQLVLPADDKRAAALSVVTNPKSLREHFGIETSSSRFMWTEWSDDLIYSSQLLRHSEIHIARGQPRRLVNITAAVLARHWRPQSARGQTFQAWAGMDFNVRGHAMVMELFGEGDTVEAAVANEASWTVLVSDEVQVDGTTLELADQLKQQAGVIPVWYDPHGAQGHPARGTGNYSDAEILQRVGLVCAPANGADPETGKPLQLSGNDSRNVMHALMKSRRLLVHERCSGFIDAMHKDMQRPDGKPDKRSSPDSETDFRSGYSDSGRYGIWPIFQANYLLDPCSPSKN